MSSDITAIALFILALYVTPGPATLSLAASGAALGLRQSMSYFLGIQTGLISILLLCMFGLAFIVTDYPGVYAFLKYCSLIYILYLSYKISQSRPNTSSNQNTFTYRSGLALNLINPKAYVANIAVIAQFSRQDDYFASVTLIFIMILICVSISNIFWVMTGERIARLFQSERATTIIQYSFAALLSSSVIYATFFI
ncbi:MAG: LysE family translocator [Calditrichaeota bacterium]|nr:LysE family translocator [Calditrichota bacterium]